MMPPLMHLRSIQDMIPWPVSGTQLLSVQITLTPQPQLVSGTWHLCGTQLISEVLR